MLDPGVTSRGGNTSMTLNRKHTFNKESFQSQGELSRGDMSHCHSQGDSMPASVFSDTNTVDVKSDKLTVFKPVNNGDKKSSLLSLH